MALRVVGAGMGRTGTRSLKLALERLLGAPCYHGGDLFPRPHHIEAWHRAVLGDPPDWDELFDGFEAAVDWPAGAFWRELSEAFPDAVVLLSVRDPEDWWRSADRTTLEAAGRRPPRPGFEAWHAMATDLLKRRFTERFDDHDEALAAFERHNAEVRAGVAPERLVEWRPGDGWAPLCAGLGLPVPDEPFPHANSTSEFRSIAGWDP